MWGRDADGRERRRRAGPAVGLGAAPLPPLAVARCAAIGIATQLSCLVSCAAVACDRQRLYRLCTSSSSALASVVLWRSEHGDAGRRATPNSRRPVRGGGGYTRCFAFFLVMAHVMALKVNTVLQDPMRVIRSATVLYRWRCDRACAQLESPCHTRHTAARPTRHATIPSTPR